MADVGLVLDIELHQQVEISGCGIDFGRDLGICELVRHIVGLAELALDLDEKGYHPPLRPMRPHDSGCRNPAKSRRVDKARQTEPSFGSSAFAALVTGFAAP